MVKKNWLLVLEGVMVVLIVGLGFLLKWNIERVGWEKIEEVFPDRGVPRMNITLNGVSLEEIDGGSKDVKYEGNGLTIYDGRSEVNAFDGVQMKGRGNGTWTQEKKPYQIRFNEKVDLFGMGKARKWCLLANAMDGSNLRTEIAFNVVEMLEMENAMKGQFIELYVNETYQGLYYLTHVVEIGKSIVDLKNPMGILIELDNLYWPTEEYYRSQEGDVFVIKDVKTKDLSAAALDIFMKAYNEFETAVKNKDYTVISEIIDIDSFAEYYLISEFSVNPDAYWTSFYFYKDGEEDKIHAGPAWDFDLAFGNRRWANWMGEVFYSPTETMIRKRELLTEEEYRERDLERWFSISESLSKIMFRLVEIPEFMERVKEIFNERISGRKKELNEIIWAVYDEIKLAIMANDELWDVDYSQEETKGVMEWMDERFDYLEQIYGEKGEERRLL